MATLIRLPPPTIKTNQSNKPYFTLHKYINTVMAWETPDTKMAVVAFKRRNDVHAMGSMIEYHHRATHEWPDFRNMTFTSGPVHDKPLEILDVYEWSNVDELKMFCALRYFDLILVDTINESFNISGQVYTLELPEEAHVPYLESLLTSSD
jgi:hypothetical protein